jgi:hypothetical protein
MAAFGIGNRTLGRPANLPRGKRRSQGTTAVKSGSPKVFIHILNKSTDTISGTTIQINPTNIGLVDGSMSYMAFDPDALPTSWAALASGNTFTIDMPPHDYRVVWLDGTEA